MSEGRRTTAPRPLPYQGELFPATRRGFAEIVVFVHHYNGSKRSLARHIALVNELGFDAVAFNLLLANFVAPDAWPVTPELKLGARHVWTGQIEAVLNLVHGEKIVFSLSSPTNSAIAAIARRGGVDIRVLVCDGGPFLQLHRCFRNLLAREYGVHGKIAIEAATLAAYGFYGPGLERGLPKIWAQVPSGFPILSIRGGQDPLVPEEAIDQFFSHQNHVALGKLTLPDAGHLDGLKRFPTEYRGAVERFVSSLSR